MKAPEEKKLSPILAFGLLLNIIALFSREHLPEIPGMVLQIASIILMVVGIAQSAYYLKKQDQDPEL